MSSVDVAAMEARVHPREFLGATRTFVAHHRGKIRPVELAAGWMTVPGRSRPIERPTWLRAGVVAVAVPELRRMEMAHVCPYGGQ